MGPGTPREQIRSKVYIWNWGGFNTWTCCQDSSLEQGCSAQCWAILEVPLLVLSSLGCLHSTVPRSELRSCPPMLREPQLAWAEQTNKCRWGHRGPAPSWAAQPLPLTERCIQADVVVDFRLMCFTTNAWMWEQIQVWHVLFWARFRRQHPSQPSRLCSWTTAFSP